MGTALCKRHCAFCQHRSDGSNERTSTPKQAVSLFYANPSALHNRHVTLYNYKPRISKDLLVKEGEEIEILSREGEWALVQKVEEGDEENQVKQGYVPSSFVAEIGSLAAARWFFGSMIHVDVKRCLLRAENQNGSFLVWQNKEMNDSYFLSVRYGDMVKHYEIKDEANFQNLSRLINNHSNEAGYLCTRLTEPCVKLDRPSISTLARVAEWEIQYSSLQKGDLIGQGQFGEVWKGIWNGTTEVAIKELKGVDSKLKKEFLEEAEIMKQLHHERLIKLLAVCTDSEPFCIVTELMTKGNLHKYLKSHSEIRNLEISLLNGFAIQIAEGMAYLEERCCVHRDLRTENVLLTEMLCCKISDFGLARLLKSDRYSISYDAKVPIKWMAPEIFHDQSYTTKSDVWSFGVLLTEIITYGGVPFPDKKSHEFVNDLMDEVTISPPVDFPDDLRDIVLQCWNHSSEKRPTFEELQTMLMNCTPMLKTVELLSLT
ncbi:tyrosine-protein kinase SRK3 [Leucoraja erinacea]|uniref:tyrosine-protein kinase SRK3 n=1 Tax=Leucoraja erinaceus TaxID=7782 RepID=UPI002453C0C1|nr:tyrosine-protein kinase SRK3 [Leucoraja erinacea]